MTRMPSAVSRRVVGGSTLGQPTEELRHVQTSGSPPLLQRAVVVEVIDNPSALTEDQKQAIAENVNNPEYVDIMPTNAVIARLISDSQDLGTPISTILFPFFASYIQLPVVPGEQVSVVYDDPTRSGTVIGYWLCRTSEQRTVEDVNYNVSDRRFFPEYNPQQISTSEQGRDQEHTPGFPNGGDTQASFTLRVTGSNGQNPYDGIIQGSTSIQNFTFEPVPRFNKRVGELVLQGKNNSAIILGEDRTGPVVRAEADARGQAGSIDLVAGRGRVLPQQDSEEPEGNAPRLITNTRDQREVNKTPYLQEGRQDNPREGDPDFVTDAARILVTMQSEADKNFGITEITFPDDTLVPEQPNEGSAGTVGKSYVLAKADHIRLISRKNDDINGTILAIREGEGEDDLFYLYVDPDGKLQVYAPEMYLGKATGKAEPYIKWTEYKNSIQNLQDQINALKDFCNQLTTTLQTAFSTAIAVPYSQIASLNAVANVLPNTVYRPLDTTITQKKQDLLDGGDSAIVNKAKSTRIFGE